MNSRELYEAFTYVEDIYLDMADAPKKEQIEMKKRYLGRRVFTVLVAAAICVSLLAVTAMAAGWIPNIFASVKASNAKEQEVLAAAAQATQAYEPEIVTVPEIDFTQFTLFERYYDGETILLGYDLSKVMPEIVVGFQPDDALLTQIKALPRWQQASPLGQEHDILDENYALGYITEESYQGALASRTEYAKQYRLNKYWQIVMDRQMKDTLSSEQYERFWRILLENGACCVAIPQKPFVSDHTYINGTDCGEVLGPDCGSFRSDYSTDIGDCILLNPIPDSTRNLHSVDVTIRLKSGWHYWYMELDGDVYEKYIPNDTYDATFTIENINN